MATIQAKTGWLEDGNWYATWTGITEADTGSTVVVPAEISDTTIQGDGDFTTSGAATFEGSNSNSTFATLKDNSATDIVINAATKIWKADHLPRYVRPRATAGTAVAMDIYLFGRRSG